jgi:hypothetical protein
VSVSPASLPRPRPPDDGAEDLRDYLEPAFLAEAGWDPGTRTLAPSPGHPLLGYRLCLVRGCAGQGRVPDGLCDTCRKARRQGDLGDEEFLEAGPAPGRHSGEVICTAGGCPRPVRVKRLQLCYTHEHRRRTLGLPLEEFLRHPRAEPLPASADARSRSAPGRHTPGEGSAALTTSAGGNSTVPAWPTPRISPPGAGQAHRSPAVTRS